MLKRIASRIAKLAEIRQQRGFGFAAIAFMGEAHRFYFYRSRWAGRRMRQLARTGTVRAHTLLKPFRKRPVPREGSILLIGYIDASLGLGESCRGLALALDQTDVPFSIFPFGVGVEGRRSEAYMAERYDFDTVHAVNIVEVAVNELRTVFANLSDDYFDRSYLVLRTYWELAKAPEAWRPCLAKVDELWVPNEFVAESFREIFDRTITIVPPCVHPQRPCGWERARLGLEMDRFYFLFSFDYYSFPQRKNPLAVVRAFQAAFPDQSAPVGLIVKSTGATDHFPELKEAMRHIERNDRRFRVIDEKLSREEMLALIDLADCYVSLHRAEGFGLGMAEAMAFGKPVIGTDYSGNTEFLTEETGYPVPFTLKPVGTLDYVYSDGQFWADPDEAACSRAMQRVIEDRIETSRRASNGQQKIRSHYGPGNVGRIIEERVTEIFERRTQRRSSIRH